MFNGIFKIAGLCIVVGAASIPLSFGINSSPIVVWFGNALGSLISAAVVIFISERITSGRFKGRMSKGRMGKKVVTIFDEGDDNKKVIRVRFFVNKHGLRIFSFLCPIFPGVLISTAAVYLLDLDKHLYKRWMLAGVFFVSGAYVFAYWLAFVKP
jgi:hypothetical protein